MTPKALAERIDGLIVDADATFARRVISVESKLYNDLSTVLKFVDVDENGYIKQNAGNRQVLRAGQKQFDQTIRESGYQGAVEGALRTIPAIDAANEAYFESVASAFKPNRQFIASIQGQAIETVNSYLLQDGVRAQVKIPLDQILNQNINTGGSFSGMLEQVRTFVKGKEDLDGRLLSYSRGILKDTLFQYARAYQNSVTDDLGLVWYLYSGGIMDKSRPFCIARFGKYFHQKEIESWADLDWAGKNPLTTKSSIFILLGGYNCTHQPIPVHESIVPAEDIARAREAGYL